MHDLTLPRRHRLAPPWRTALTTLVAATLAGCGGSGQPDGGRNGYVAQCHFTDTYVATAVLLPEPTGSHCVSRLDLHLVDPQRRMDHRETDPARHRELMLTIYYPSAAGSTGPRSSYLNPTLWGMLLDETQLHDYATGPVVPMSGRDRPMAHGQRYPVVLFSHGWGLPSLLYASLAEEIASHGAIVVAIEHSRVASVVMLPDGRIIDQLGGDDEDDEDALTDDDYAQLSQIMTDDQRFVLNWLQTHGTGLERIGGAFDFNRVGSVGHSLGGSAALQASRTDHRIRAGINIDGRVFGELFGPWTKPMLIMTSIDDTLHESQEEVLRRSVGPTTVATLAGADHNDFSDMRYVFERYRPPHLEEIYDGWNLRGSDPAEVVLRDARARILGFLRQHVMR
ncbi:MAG: alpha/beta hydrolase family protein [Rhodocyclaceae bacterium]